MTKNIVLIGMPGVGKSTLGVLLAKQQAMDFVDTDLLIQHEQQRTLQHILDERGYVALRQMEADILCTINCNNSVIATGGSAVYCPAAMNHLKTNGIVVYLSCDLAVLKQRIDNLETRGIASPPQQSLLDIFNERTALYSTYADITVDVGQGSTADCLKQVTMAIKKNSPS